MLKESGIPWKRELEKRDSPGWLGAVARVN